MLRRSQQRVNRIIRNHHKYELPEFIFLLRKAAEVSRNTIMHSKTQAVTLGNLELNKHKPSRAILMTLSTYFNVPFELIAIKASKMVHDNYYSTITLTKRPKIKRKDKECS